MDRRRGCRGAATLVERMVIGTWKVVTHVIESVEHVRVNFLRCRFGIEIGPSKMRAFTDRRGAAGAPGPELLHDVWKPQRKK